MEKIGEKIRKIRTLKGLSQENMATMLEISLVAYGDIERCKTNLTNSRLEQIAQVLEMNVEDILSFDDKIAFIFNNSGSAFGAYNQNNYSQSNQIPLEIEKLSIQIELLRVEKEKAEWQAKYWEQKFKQQTE